MEYLTYNEEHFEYFQIKEEKSPANANLDWRGQTSAGEKVHSSKKTPASPDCFSSTVWNENTFLLLQETERVRPHWWRCETWDCPGCSNRCNQNICARIIAEKCSFLHKYRQLTDWLTGPTDQCVLNNLFFVLHTSHPRLLPSYSWHSITFLIMIHAAPVQHHEEALHWVWLKVSLLWCWCPEYLIVPVSLSASLQT